MNFVSYTQTNNYDVLSAILNCNDYEREQVYGVSSITRCYANSANSPDHFIISHRWEKRHSIIRTPWNEIGRREVLEFAIVQKDPRGFEILHEKYKKRLQRYGVSPSMWIFRKLLCSYFTTFKLNLRTL